MNKELLSLIEDQTVDLRSVRLDLLVEIADRWLRVERAKRLRATARGFERDSQIRALVDSAISNAVNRMAREAGDRIENEWAPSFLAQKFALPDGTSVSWGAASAAQHEMRAAFLERMAAGDIQTAAMHRKAIADIRARGVGRLTELESVAA